MTEGSDGMTALDPLASTPEPGPGQRGKRWQSAELVQLLDEIADGCTITQLVVAHGRTRSAIKAAMMRLLPIELRPESRGHVLGALSYHLKEQQACDREVLAAQYFAGKPPRVAGTSRGRYSSIDEDDLPSSLEERRPLVATADAFALVSEAVSEVRDERDRKVLQLRLGTSGHPQTLAEIGQSMGVSRERVRQLQIRALSYLACRARRPGSPGDLLGSLLAGLEMDSELLVQRLIEIAEYFDTSPTVAFHFVLRVSGSSLEHATIVTDAASVALRSRIETEGINAAEQAKQHREMKATENLEARVSKWLGQADWGDNVQPPISIERLSMQRNVGPESAGAFWSAKLARRVHYESSVEREILNVLERSDQIAYYQEQPFAIPYAFDGRSRRYFPDIFAATVDGRGLLLEVKPIPNMAISMNRAKADAGRSWANQHGWGWITLDSQSTFADLVNHEVTAEARFHLDRELLTNGRLTWPDLLATRQRYELSSFDVTAYVVQSDAQLTLEPRYEITPREAR